MNPLAPFSSLHLSGVPLMYRAFWRFAEGQRLRMITASGLLVGSQLVKLTIPWLAAKAINAVQIGGGRDLQESGMLIVLILLAAALSWSMHGPGRVMERSVGIRVRENLADRLYARVASLPLAWHEAHHTGETQARLEKASGALYNFAQNQFIYLQNSVNLVGPLVALVLLSTTTGVAAIVGYLCVGLVITRFDKSLLRLAHAENVAHNRYAAALVDCLGNVSTVISLRLQSATRSILRARLAEVFVPLRKSLTLVELKWCSVDLMTIALSWGLVTLYAASSHRSGGALLLGNVFMVYQYAQQSGGVIGAIASHYQNFARMQVDYASADPIWQAAERRDDPMSPPSEWKRLQVDGLDFEYRTARRGPALHGVHLSIARGERIALIGGSGSGKTTLMRVMAGLYDASSGCYSFDGVLYPGVRDLRRISTLIPQEADLFDGSVRDNLTFGAPHDDETIATAIRIAGLESVLAGLPRGLETIVSERGLNLSGGQKQRIALARGILAAQGSSLVFLDEPTSSLDALTEAQVFEALASHFPDATIIASVHRLHLLPRFDRVILMGAGHVIDVGSVDELLGRQPLFRELWQRATETGKGATADLRAA